MPKQNFYEILKSSPTASFEELRRNYKQLILQCHPDKLQHDNADTITTPTKNANIDIDATTVTNDATSTTTATVDLNVEIPIATFSDQLVGEFVVINEAWNTLKDPIKRRLYDAELLLTKFQAHSNIFARLKLADMKRCAATATNSDSGSDSDVGGEGEGKSSTYWYYTYDCRCGGQYIVDESADSEILNRNRKHTATTAPHKGNGKDNAAAAQELNTQQKQMNYDDNDNDDKNCQAAVGSSKVNVNPTICGNNSNSETTNIDENIVDAAVADVVGDHDIDGDEEQEEEGEEVLVECSECSLVIVLT